MCLIIHKPAGATIPDFAIESALQYNPDGFGYMAADGSTGKTGALLTVADVRAILSDIDNVDAALHFRMATDGKVCEELAHPFELADGSLLMHNGILTAFRTSSKSNKSDTSVFCESILNPMLENGGQIIAADIEQHLLGNRLCHMTRDNQIIRYGADWLEYEGCHYSNTYAWDAPGYGLYDNARYAADSDSDALWLDDTGTLWYTVNREQSEMSDLMLDRLAMVADMLPLNSYDHIASQDMQYLDGLLSGLIDEFEFLEMCSEETLLALYTVAVDQRLIAA